MKNILFVSALLLPLVNSAFANTVYNNFTGYAPHFRPFGSPLTATYGETFTAPTNNDTDLESFGLYLAGPFTPGDILLSAYIATWTGTNAGTLLFASPAVDYGNTGDAELTFSPSKLSLTPGATYVAFLSVSQYYGQSSGRAYMSAGTASIPGGNFVFSNNAGDFNALFTSAWDGTGIKPDWAFTATFTSSVPEPGTLALLGIGLFAASLAIRRRKNY